MLVMDYSPHSSKVVFTQAYVGRRRMRQVTGAKSVSLRSGVRLEYVQQGDPSGLPVVFLHGVTDSWRSFEGVLSRLPSSMHAVALSQRGHGGSSRPVAGYRIVDFSSDLDAFLDKLDIPAALIVGHSMGSYVAQRFAMDHPGRTLGLVLMGAFPALRGHAGVPELWGSAVSTLLDPMDPRFVLDFQQRILARPVPRARLETLVRETLKVPAHVWRAAFVDCLESDFSKELATIKAPTLIVCGDQDALFPRCDQAALHAAIPASRLVVYPGAGHAFHWEDPAQFATDLVAFGHEHRR
ncbi:MAG: alpha/beta fold hydrolase [Luteitalea sp.]|nr:alpha/beta fold hydrolase [Luteitalea sp.]